MKHISLISAVLFLLPLQTLTSQSLRDYERAGDDAFEHKDYGTAFQRYRDVLRRREDDLSLWWKYGESARLYNSFPEAERSYKRIADSQKYAYRHPLVDYRLAEVKKSQGDYESAIAYFEKFLSEKPRTEPVYFELAKSEIENCHVAQAIAAAPLNVQVKHLGKEVNSPFYDFAPSIVGDTLFFSSNRFDKKILRSKQKRKLSKIMFSLDGRRSIEPGKGFPSTDTAHIAHTTFSPDGHFVVFSVCQDLNGNDKRCELWLTILDGKKQWTEPVRLPQPINLEGYSSTQPNIGYDEDAKGLVLWFASDRPGGKGKLDIWSSPLDTNYFCSCMLPMFNKKKVVHLPEFAEPVNASEVNTPGNDATPFYFSPGQQLFFSSDGWPGLGGFDVFFSGKNNGALSVPQNAGTGINTSYNDLYFVLKKNGLDGYLSSNRPGSLFLDDKNQACCNDLFSFNLSAPIPQTQPVEPEQPAPQEVVVEHSDSVAMPSNQAAKSPEIPELPPVVTPVVPELPSLDEFRGLPLYFDNDEPEKRTRKTSTSLSYETTVQSYLARREEYKKRFSDGLTAEQATKAGDLIETFFQNEIRRGSERLNQLCDVLVKRLQQGESLEVILKGYTSPRANSDYNRNLAQRRICSLKNQFESFQNGALKPYIQSGKLKINELSFGETVARPGISDELKDERASVYHPDAARERRVEIVEVVIR